MGSILSLEEIKALIKEVKEAKEAGIEEEVEEVIPAPPRVEVKPPTPEVVDKRSAKERIAELIQRGERVSANYYAARGSNIIEIVIPKEYEEDTYRIITSCKIDPKAPEVMLQDPSFAEVNPKDARGIGAFQLYVDNPKQLVTSGYDVLRIIRLLKDKPVLVTASTTINPKPLINAFKE
jgi:hypothetical protein